MARLLAMLLWFVFVLSGGEAQAFSRVPCDQGGHSGQVLTAERHRTIGAAPDDSDPVIPGQGFLYACDGLGNRTSATRGGGGITADGTLTCSPAASNQYTAIASNRTGIVTGSADPAASVTINSSPAPRSGPWFGQSKATTAGTTAAWLTFSIDATLAGITDHTDSALLIPPSTLSPVYDADGNLTDDGLRTFTWDADSRLLSVTTKDTLLPAGAPMYRVTYQYDDGGRRIAQTTEARTSPTGAYALVHRRCFLYDGWNCIAEYDYAPAGSSATRTLYRTAVWGASLAPGGAGGLIAIRRHTGPLTGTHFATHDGNGNVTALVNAATGTESARYDYDPYGNPLLATGPFAAENPFRFSTQFTDDITGLLYYGYRHFDPVQGRWLSRDPIGEAGGVNLYGFVGNDGVNQVDVLEYIAEALSAAPAETPFGVFENIGKSLGKQWKGQSNRFGVGAIAASVAYVAWQEAANQLQRVAWQRIGAAAASVANCCSMNAILIEAIHAVSGLHAMVDLAISAGDSKALQDASTHIGIALSVMHTAMLNIERFCPDMLQFGKDSERWARDLQTRVSTRLNQEAEKKLSHSTPEARRATVDAAERELQNLSTSNPFGNPSSTAKVGLSFGESATSKLRQHFDDLKKLMAEAGQAPPRKFKEGESAFREFLSDVVQQSEKTGVGPYKPAGGGAMDAIWSRKGNVIVIQRSDGTVLTVLDASGGGAALNFPGGL